MTGDEAAVLAAVGEALAPYELRLGTAGLLVEEAALVAVQAAAPVLRRQLAAAAGQAAAEALREALEAVDRVLAQLEAARGALASASSRAAQLEEEARARAGELGAAVAELDRYRDALARIDRGEGDAMRIARETLGPVRR